MLLAGDSKLPAVIGGSVLALALGVVYLAPARPPSDFELVMVDKAGAPVPGAMVVLLPPVSMRGNWWTWETQIQTLARPPFLAESTIPGEGPSGTELGLWADEVPENDEVWLRALVAAGWAPWKGPGVRLGGGAGNPTLVRDEAWDILEPGQWLQKTDAQGRIVWPGIPRGRWQMAVVRGPKVREEFAAYPRSSSGSEWSEAQILGTYDHLAGVTTTKTVVAKQVLRRLRGRLGGSGQLRGPAWVAVNDNQSRRQVALADSEGYFELLEPPAGKLDLWAQWTRDGITYVVQRDDVDPTLSPNLGELAPGVTEEVVVDCSIWDAQGQRSDPGRRFGDEPPVVDLTLMERRGSAKYVVRARLGQRLRLLGLPPSPAGYRIVGVRQQGWSASDYDLARSGRRIQRAGEPDVLEVRYSRYAAGELQIHVTGMSRDLNPDVVGDPFWKILARDDSGRLEEVGRATHEAPLVTGRLPVGRWQILAVPDTSSGQDYYRPNVVAAGQVEVFESGQHKLKLRLGGGTRVRGVVVDTEGRPAQFPIEFRLGDVTLSTVQPVYSAGATDNFTSKALPGGAPVSLRVYRGGVAFNSATPLQLEPSGGVTRVQITMVTKPDPNDPQRTLNLLEVRRLEQ